MRKKKLIAAILIIALLWGGFYYVNLLLRRSDVQTSEVPSVNVTLDRDTYHKLSQKIKVTIENNRDYEIVCSTLYDVEYKRGSRWHRATVEPCHDVRPSMNLISARTTSEVEFDMSKLDWRLPWGRCRILIYISYGDEVEESQTATVVREFNVIF